MKKNLSDKWIAGVCSGIANYFNIDPIIVRLAWIFIALASGLIVPALIYVFAALIME